VAETLSEAIQKHQPGLSIRQCGQSRGSTYNSQYTSPAAQVPTTTRTRLCTPPISSPIKNPSIAPHKNGRGEEAIHFNSSHDGGNDPFRIRWRREEESEILTFVQEHGDEGGGPEADEDPFCDCAGEVEEEGAAVGEGFGLRVGGGVVVAV
jgi:hypothetical protein